MTLTVAPDLVIKLYNLTKTLDGPIENPSLSNIWFPTPSELTTLPSTPVYDTNSELIAVNSISAPEWFNPELVDIEQFFNDLVPTNINPVYPVELETAIIVDAQNEILPVTIVLRSLLCAYTAEYSLVAQITTTNLVTKTIVKTLSWVAGASTTYSIVGHSAELNKSYDPINREGSYSIEGQNVNFSVRPYKIEAEVYPIELGYAKTITSIGGEATILDLLEETDSIPSGSGVSIDFATYKFGVSSITASANTVLGLLRRPGKTSIGSGQDFTVSFWFNQRQDMAQNSVSGLLQLTDKYGLCQYRPPGASETFLAFGLFDEIGYIQSGNKYFVPLIVHGQTLQLDTFIHVAIESYNQQIRLYINGIQAIITEPNPGVIFDTDTNLTLFGFCSFIDDVLVIDSDISTTSAYIDDFVIDNFGRYAGQNFALPANALSNKEATLLTRVRTLFANNASVALVGQIASIGFIQKSIGANLGYFDLGGQSANLKKFNVKMPAEASSFILTGFDVNEGPYFVSGSVVSSGFTGGVSPYYVVRTFNPPSGYQLNDVMIFMAETSGDSALFPSMTGWTLVNNAPVVDIATSSGSKFYVWWRRITSTREPFWSLPIQDHIAASVFLVRNVDPSHEPIVSYATSSTTVASTNVSAPGFTLNAPLSRVFALVASPSDSSGTTRYSNLVNNSLTDLVEHFEYGTTSGNGGSVMAVSGKRLKSGVVSATTMTKTFSSTDTICTIAFRSSYVEVAQSPVLIGQVVSYSVNGQNATFTRSIYLTGQVSTVNLTGQNATFMTGIILMASASTYTLSGQAASFNRNYAINGAVTSYAVSGQNATLTYSGAIGTLGDQFELTALLEDDLLVMDF